MSDIEADLRNKLEKTEAVILAGGIKPGQYWFASDTKVMWYRSVDGTTYSKVEGDITGTVQTIVAGDGIEVDDTIPSAPIVTALEDAGKRSIVHGFIDPENMVAVFDNPTRTFTYSHPSEFVEFWAGSVYYKFANGDPQLEVIVPNLSQYSWLYFDIDGQLKSKTTLVWAEVKVVCLGHLARYSTVTSQFILTIARWEDCQANHVENYASYRSKALQGVVGEGIGFIGVGGGSLLVGNTSASYLSSRDFEFNIPPADEDTIDWLRYHYDGADDAGAYDANLSVSPAPTGTPVIIGTDIGLAGTNAIYNIYDDIGDSFTVVECPSNDYVIGHIGVGDGGSQKIISLAPQGKYATVNSAIEAIDTEKDKLINSDDIFRDVAIVASYIVKGNLSGGFLPVDAEGNIFHYHTISLGGSGGASANNQSLDDVATIGAITDKLLELNGGAITDMTPAEIEALGGSAFQTGDSTSAHGEESYLGKEGNFSITLENVDLDTVVAAGMYRALNVANYPPQESAGYGYLTVLQKDGNDAYQQFTRSVNTNTYIRLKRSSGWTTWARLVDATKPETEQTDSENLAAGAANSKTLMSHGAGDLKYDPIKGADDNYVTDAEKVVIGNTSGANTGDQDLSGLVEKAAPVTTQAAAADYAACVLDPKRIPSVGALQFFEDVTLTDGANATVGSQKSKATLTTIILNCVITVTAPIGSFANICNVPTEFAPNITGAASAIWGNLIDGSNNSYFVTLEYTGELLPRGATIPIGSYTLVLPSYPRAPEL